MFAFRITTSYEEFSKNTAFPDLLNSCNRCCIYEHIPDYNEQNVHIHGLLIHPMYLTKGELRDDTPEHMRRAYFAKYYKNLYSLKECDNELKYLVYCSKGKYLPKMFYNIPKMTQQEVNDNDPQYHVSIRECSSLDPYNCSYFEWVKLQWVAPTQVNVKLVDGKLVREQGKNKLSKRELIDIMMADYKVYMPMEDVIKLIRKTLIKNNEVLGLYKVMDYYDALLMYSNKQEFTALIISKINSRVRV